MLQISTDFINVVLMDYILIDLTFKRNKFGGKSSSENTFTAKLQKQIKAVTSIQRNLLQTELFGDILTQHCLDDMLYIYTCICMLSRPHVTYME